MSAFLQYLFSGVTVGAIYAIVGIGFAIVYNASRVINFAQGEFVMIGGMATAALLAQGVPLWGAIPLAILLAAALGWALDRFAVGPARGASVVTVIIITIGASILIRGVVEVTLGKQFHSLPGFSGDAPLAVGGATLNPQGLWVLAGLAAVGLGLRWFFGATRFGKAMLATADNRLAAQLVGIDVRRVLLASFALAAALGAFAGILTAPITLTQYDIGLGLGLKGFAAAILGGIGNPFGAIAGGLALGIAEQLSAGYLSSAYKDAVAFVAILAVLLVRPAGLLGARTADRV